MRFAFLSTSGTMALTKGIMQDLQTQKAGQAPRVLTSCPNEEVVLLCWCAAGHEGCMPMLKNSPDATIVQILLSGPQVDLQRFAGAKAAEQLHHLADVRPINLWNNAAWVAVACNLTAAAEAT